MAEGMRKERKRKERQGILLAAPRPPGGCCFKTLLASPLSVPTDPTLVGLLLNWKGTDISVGSSRERKRR